MGATNDGSGMLDAEEIPIILIGIAGREFFLLHGEDHLDQVLLADGKFPKPVKCLNFGSRIEVKMLLGETVNVAAFWAIHPDIVARLRDAGDLVEIDG